MRGKKILKKCERCLIIQGRQDFLSVIFPNVCKTCRSKEKNRVFEKDGVQYKKCKHCEEIKIITDFIKSKLRCKACNRKYDTDFYRKERAKLGITVKSPRKNVSQEQKHKEMLEASKRYRERHPERRKEICSRSAKKNIEQIRIYRRNRYNTDILFNLVTKIRRRISMAFIAGKRGLIKSDKTIKLLGCSFAELKSYIESKFINGMTWDDVITSKIHLDHIIPVVAFDLSNPEQQAKCFHYTNLQPLWKEDNYKKNDKLPDGSSVRRVRTENQLNLV